MSSHRVSIPALRLFIAVLSVLVASGVGLAQSIDELLDEKQYLEGLSELNVPEVLEHYIATHPTDDPARQTYYQIARQRMAMRRPDTTPAQRVQQLETVLALRRALIDQQLDDPRRVTWLCDQAAAWMFEMFNIDAAGWTAVFGSPMPAQRKRAAESAEHALQLTVEARSTLEETLLRIESQPGFASDVSAQLRRQRLIDRERRRRLPLVAGISAAVHAELSTNGVTQRRELYSDAVSQLESVTELVDGAAACHARLYLALSLTRLERYDEAEIVLERMISATQCNADLKLLAGLVSVQLAGARGGPSAALQTIDDVRRQSGAMTLLQRVLLTDQLFQWRMVAARQSSSNTAAMQARAYDAYLDLLKLNLDEPAEVVRSVVVSRIANVADDSTPLAQLPPLAAVALAESRAREPATRSEAIELLRDVLDRGDVVGEDRAAALFSLGRALYEDHRTLDAARRFLELARDHQTDAQAERAAELAATLSFSTFERQKSAAEARSMLGEALELIHRQYPNLPGTDRWQYVAGELALYEQRYNDASAHFDAVPANSDRYLDALFMRGNVARLAAEAEEDRLKRLTLNEQAVKRIKEVRVPIESAINSGGVSSSRLDALRYYVTYLNVFEAQALLEMTDAEQALAVLDRTDLDSIADSEALADVLLTRIRAYQALGRSGEAQQEVRAYLEAAPDQVSQVLPPMMLDIEREVRELLEFGLKEEAGARAHRELLPLANLLSRWLNNNPQWRGDEYRLRRRIASGFELSGEFALALAEYDRLLAQHPNLLGLLLGKAEALYHLGEREQLAEAMRIYKRIGAAEGDQGSTTYWQAQLRMLQILDAVGQNTDQIAPRIKQLEQRDASLGGPQLLPEFNELRRKYR